MMLVLNKKHMKTTYSNVIITLCIILMGLNICVAQVNYTSHHPCTFDIQLPTSFIFEDAFPEDDNLDICNYYVKWSNNEILFEVNSNNASRFEYSTMPELYDAAIKNNKLDISYKTQKKNWFVISGINKENKKIVYWKRVLGETFISDLYIEYPSSSKDLIEPYIGTISKSFISD